MWEELPILCWEHIAEYAVCDYLRKPRLTIDLFVVMHCFMVLCHATRCAAVSVFRGDKYGVMRFYRDCIVRLRNTPRYKSMAIVQTPMVRRRQYESRGSGNILGDWFDRIMQRYNLRGVLPCCKSQRLQRLENTVFKYDDQYSFGPRSSYESFSIGKFIFAVNRLLFWYADRRAHAEASAARYTNGFFHLARLIGDKIVSGDYNLPEPIACNVAARILRKIHYNSILCGFGCRLARFVINTHATVRLRVKGRPSDTTFVVAFNWLYACDRVRSARDLEKFGKWYSGEADLGKRILRSCVNLANVNAGVTLLSSYLVTHGKDQEMAKTLVSRDFAKCSALHRTSAGETVKRKIEKIKRDYYVHTVHLATRYNDNPFVKPVYKGRGGAAVKKKYARLVEGWRLVVGLRDKRVKFISRLPIVDLECMAGYIKWNRR